jgi:hypothetical protein
MRRATVRSRRAPACAPSSQIDNYDCFPVVTTRAVNRNSFTRRGLHGQVLRRNFDAILHNSERQLVSVYTGFGRICFGRTFRRMRHSQPSPGIRDRER